MPDGTLNVARLVERAKANEPLPEGHLLVESSSEATATSQDPALAASTLAGKINTSDRYLTPTRSDAPVHAIVKTTRNPFADMITVGRALNNDIIISDGGISKFHGYLRVTGAEVRYHDAGSTNGSRVDGRAVGREGIILSTMSRVELGPTKQLVFIARDEVRGWLSALSGVGAPVAAKPIARKEEDPSAATHKMPSPLGPPVDPSALVTQREVVGSLARETIEVILGRLATEKWSGRLEASVHGGPRIEVALVGGKVGGFRCNGKPGTPRDLARVMAATAGMYLLRKNAASYDLDGQGWLGPVPSLLQEARSV